MLNKFIIDETLKFSSDFARKNAEAIPILFQVSLLKELDVRPEKIPEIFLHIVERALPYDTALLYVWEPKDAWYCRGLQGKIPETIEYGDVFTDIIKKTSRPMLIPDFERSGLKQENTPIPFSSMIGLPIFIDTATIGCVEIFRKQGKPFDINDVTLIKHFLLYSEKALEDVFDPEKIIGDATDLRSGTPNEHILVDILHRQAEQAQRLAYPLSIAIIDIDPDKMLIFKDITGWIDKMQHLFIQIKDGLRCYDKLLRYEEMSFIAILPGSSTQEAMEAIGKATAQMDTGLYGHINIGFAEMPKEAQDAKGLINAAQQALSHSRKNNITMAGYFQANPSRIPGMPLDMDMIRVMGSPPSVDTLNDLLAMFTKQCHAKKIAIVTDTEARAVQWEHSKLGNIECRDLPEDIYSWVISFLSPAWAVVAGLDTDMDNWYWGMLLCASILSDIRSGFSMGYSIRVSDEMYTLARAMGMDAQKATNLANSALGANIGYLGIPASIFTKGELSPFDRQRINAHPIISARILKGTRVIDFDRDCLVLHHENMDGSGYPRGIKGMSIPEGARALRVVDTYNAMISPRLYRTQMQQKDAVEQMHSLKENLLDPDITSLYMDLIGS
ncbi:MAG: HD domain-containing phosphohydrolase [Thermodesulfobacteriota bacterium]|nr:HD domain-containing phosphohydrolase [Thermodesulfobacteriota bacterium]